jgi:hypothetical protein
MGKTPSPADPQDRTAVPSTRTLLMLPLLALLAYLAAMIPFALFLAQGWDVGAVLEPVAVLLIFNFVVRRYYP